MVAICFSEYAMALLILKTPDLSLEEEQCLALKAVYDGKDIMGLPTGFGMSLCYQALPLFMGHKLGLAETRRSSAVLVITSLIMIMLDQSYILICNNYDKMKLMC